MTDSHSTDVHFRARGRMAVHTIWDHITRPIARTIDDVPWCAEAASAEWMTAIVCPNVPGAKAVSVQVCGGDQGSSVRRRLKVAYNDEGSKAHLPEDLFCKTTPTVLTRLATGLSAAAEGRFYREIRPELKIETPKCYHSAWDRNSGRSIHLFEDVVASKAARFCRCCGASTGRVPLPRMPNERYSRFRPSGPRKTRCGDSAIRPWLPRRSP